MEVLYPRCCGLDVHKKNVVACRITPGPDGQPQKETRTFSAMTADLLSLSDWLLAEGVTHVAMESTGVYWKPVYNLLEETFTLLLVNAQHLQRVPGRKSDVADSEWLADLLRHGLVKASFVPERGQRELRELTRYRTQLVRERTAEVNRLQKVLEGANLKLASVVSDIMGKSARAMLAGLVTGEADPATLAEMAQGRMREKLPQLEAALQGRCGSHQRFMLARQLAHIDDLERLIGEVSAEVERRLAPFEAELQRLTTIPGVNRWSAQVLIAEVGADMERFPTSRHLASWAGMCPGQNRSGAKRGSGKTRPGNPWLRSLLVQSAHAVKRQRDTYAGAQFRRLARRRGVKRAAMAVGHALLVAMYQILKHGVTYQEVGAEFFEERDRTGITRSCVRQLERLGFTVDLSLPAAA